MRSFKLCVPAVLARSSFTLIALLAALLAPNSAHAATITIDDLTDTILVSWSGFTSI
jgi:hypothetical protein